MSSILHSHSKYYFLMHQHCYLQSESIDTVVFVRLDSKGNCSNANIKGTAMQSLLNQMKLCKLSWIDIKL